MIQFENIFHLWYFHLLQSLATQSSTFSSLTFFSRSDVKSIYFDHWAHPESPCLASVFNWLPDSVSFEVANFCRLVMTVGFVIGSFSFCPRWGVLPLGVNSLCIRPQVLVSHLIYSQARRLYFVAPERQHSSTVTSLRTIDIPLSSSNLSKSICYHCYYYKYFCSLKSHCSRINSVKHLAALEVNIFYTIVIFVNVFRLCWTAMSDRFHVHQCGYS